jgi:acyl carrier protein phosphodiesterase
MNYVAHLFLAEPCDEHRIGSLLADFTNGPIDTLRRRFGDGIARGIAHHRQIDRFTDQHESVRACVDALNGPFGIYAGIVVDVVFDHFLLRHFEAFSPDSESVFFDAVYASLADIRPAFPERYRTAVQRMLERRWLSGYRELDMVAYALKRMDERFTRPTPLRDTLGGIRDAYDRLESGFLDFFPQVLHFSRTVEVSVLSGGSGHIDSHLSV